MAGYYPCCNFNAPTWRLCHPVNIYIFRNGIENEKPQLVHIPMESKKNMCTVLDAIGSRMKLPAAYPIALYTIDGCRICKSYELKSYEHYVVVTNIEKYFKCVDYGCLRGPLVVIGRDSKHVNTLRYENKRYDLFCRRKMLRKPLHELMTSDEPDGYGPSELPASGKPCGVLCHKIAPTANRPTQCCSEEIMCVEGNSMDQEEDRCRRRKPCMVPPSCTFQDKDLDDLCNKVRCAADANAAPNRKSCDNNLMDLIQKYQDVGTDIFKMFQEKISKDVKEESPTKWQLDGGSILSMETQQKLKDDLIKAANTSCQFSFDQYGNYVPTEGCSIPSDQPINMNQFATQRNNQEYQVGKAEIEYDDASIADAYARKRESFKRMSHEMAFIPPPPEFAQQYEIGGMAKLRLDSESRIRAEGAISEAVTTVADLISDDGQIDNQRKSTADDAMSDAISVIDELLSSQKKKSEPRAHASF